MGATKGFPEHNWPGNTGGSIGIACPLAVGATVAFPDRRVLCLTADGSAMYILQALWTMERESLNITTVVFDNREYAVLKRELSGGFRSGLWRRIYRLAVVGTEGLLLALKTVRA